MESVLQPKGHIQSRKKRTDKAGPTLSVKYVLHETSGKLK